MARPVKLRDDLIAVAAALAWRGFFLPLANGAYTDGVLALDTFRFGLSYWPPFYAIVARLFAWIPGVGLENAGRLVSFLAGALAVIPIMALTKTLFGRRAARWAAVAWIVSPMPMRWSLQPMTDALMVALWSGSLASVALAVAAWRPDQFIHSEGRPIAPDPKAGSRWLLIASLLGTLATLTRYQGIFLLIPIAAVMAWRMLAKKTQDSGLRTQDCLSILPWLAVPLWLAREGITPLLTHFRQIEDRATRPIDYWMMVEEFVMRGPYFVTWGLFGFFLYGLFRVNWSTWRLRWAGWIGLALMLAILALQSAFMSYQERYLFPLVPLVCVFAGHGFATWQRRCESNRLRFAAVGGPAIAYALVFAGVVAWSQTQPFEDFKLAAERVAEMPAASIGRVFTNESYNAKVDAEVGPPKAIFWSGRAVKYLPQSIWSTLQPGDVVIFSNWYAQLPLAQFHDFINAQMQAMPLRLVGDFHSSALPLFPDLVPRLNQNPMAMNFRYQPQNFETVVLQVEGAPAAGGKVELAPPPQPTPDVESQQRLQKLERLQKQLDQKK